MNKKKVLKAVKGFRGRARNCIRLARNRYEKSLLHAYRGRKLKAREFRSLWITRINAGSRLYQLPYGQLIYGMNQLQIGLNRKILSQLAITEPYSFRSIIEQVKQMTNNITTTHHYPTLGHIQTELIVNQRIPIWDTQRYKQIRATTEFIQQYYATKQQQAQQSIITSISNTLASPTSQQNVQQIAA